MSRNFFGRGLFALFFFVLGFLAGRFVPSVKGFFAEKASVPAVRTSVVVESDQESESPRLAVDAVTGSGVVLPVSELGVITGVVARAVGVVPSRTVVDHLSAAVVAPRLENDSNSVVGCSASAVRVRPDLPIDVVSVAQVASLVELRGVAPGVVGTGRSRRSGQAHGAWIEC